MVHLTQAELREELQALWLSGGVGKKALRESFYGRLYEGTGKVVYQDDFESLSPRMIALYRANVTRCTERAFQGDACLKLSPDTAVSGDRAEVRGALGMSPSRKWGIETMFYTPPVKTGEIEWHMYWQGVNGNECHRAIVRYIPGYEVVPVTPKWSLGGPGGAWQAIPDSYQNITSGWHRMKCVVDFNTHHYIYLMVDDRVYDLSAFEMNAYLFAESEGGVISLLVRNSEAVVAEVRHDNLIITEEF